MYTLIENMYTSIDKRNYTIQYYTIQYIRERRIFFRVYINWVKCIHEFFLFG